MTSNGNNPLPEKSLKATPQAPSSGVPDPNAPPSDDSVHVLAETTICSGKLSILDKAADDIPDQMYDENSPIHAPKTTNYTRKDSDPTATNEAPTTADTGVQGSKYGATTLKPDPLVLDKKILHELEADVRQKVHHSVLYNFLTSALASILVFVFHLISLECLVSIALGVAFTVYTYHATENNNGFNGSALNWTLLSFALITPMSASLRMSFTRREDALRNFAELRATFLQLYLAHLCWDWRKPGSKPSGRAASSINWLEHSDAVLANILEVADLLTRYLTLPSANRSRHRLLSPCKKDAVQLLALSGKIQDSIMHHMGYISEYCEILKQEGLPPNEASRIRQWERFIVEYIEQLRMIKHYRTPQALRSFARLFSVLLPPLYAPYFADLARQVESLGFAIVFSVITSIALTGLFETIYQMEDPFERVALLDGVHVEDEFCEIYRRRFWIMRAQYYKEAAPFSWQAIKDAENPNPIKED